MADKLKFRRDITENWENVNPILAQGEPGLDLSRNIVKLGNGSDSWSDLEQLKAVPEGWVNVKDFGAKGDGVTDDTEAIQKAITQLSGGGVLFFPAGKYLITEDININVPFITIQGTTVNKDKLEDSNGSIIILNNASFIISQNGIVFKNMGIKNLTNTTSSVILHRKDTSQNTVAIGHITFDHVLIKGGLIGLEGYGLEKCEIKNTTIQEADVGIYLYSDYYNWVIGSNTFLNFEIRETISQMGIIEAQEYNTYINLRLHANQGDGLELRAARFCVFSDIETEWNTPSDPTGKALLRFTTDPNNGLVSHYNFIYSSVFGDSDTYPTTVDISSGGSFTFINVKFMDNASVNINCVEDVNTTFIHCMFQGSLNVSERSLYIDDYGFRIPTKIPTIPANGHLYFYPGTNELRVYYNGSWYTVQLTAL